MTLSAHKLGGPQGAGALVVRDGAPLAPQIAGGGQESAGAAGTENVAAIAGFGAAAATLADGDDERARIARLRDRFESEAEGDGARSGGLRRAARRVLPTRRISPFPGLAARNRADRARSRRRDGQFGRGLFVRQGQAVACAAGDGRGRTSSRAAACASASAGIHATMAMSTRRSLAAETCARARARARPREAAHGIAARKPRNSVADLGEKYKYGFVTDIEMERAPKGLNEDTVRFISAKKGEPEWMLEWRLAAFRRWLEMHEPDLGARALSQDRLSERLLLRGAERHAAEARAWTKSIPSCWKPTRSWAFRCTSRWRWRAWRWMRCSIPFPSPPPSRRSSTKRA